MSFGKGNELTQFKFYKDHCCVEDGLEVDKRRLREVGEENIAIVHDKCQRLDLGGHSGDGENRLILRFVFKRKWVDVKCVMFLFKSDRSAAKSKVSLHRWRQAPVPCFFPEGTQGQFWIILGISFRKRNDYGVTEGHFSQKAPSEVIVSEGELVNGSPKAVSMGRAAPMARGSPQISLRCDVRGLWCALKWWKAEWMCMCVTNLSTLPSSM